MTLSLPYRSIGAASLFRCCTLSGFEDVLLPLALQSERVTSVRSARVRPTLTGSQRLQAAGFDDAAVGRIHGPVGLSIGAVTPEEIAIAILAEIVQVRHQASGTRHQS